MQNQKLTQKLPNCKEPSSRNDINYTSQKTLVTSQSKYKNENPVNGDNNGSGQNRVIQDILGYPVTQVILDEQGNIILDIGDLITYQAVERAIKAKVFDNLVSAVYIKK